MEKVVRSYKILIRDKFLIRFSEIKSFTRA